MRNVLILTVVALGATAAGAQMSVGNPPGNTAAPATGTVTTSAPSAPSAGDMVPAKTPAELAKIKYQTEMVCKTSIETGSLIARKKRCFTRKQWQYVNDENERLARKVVDDGTGRPTSN